MQDLPFQKKRKVVRLRVLLWSGVGLLVGAALIGSAYVILYADFFRVSTFEVSGSRFVSRDVLLASLNSQMLSGSLLRSLLGPGNILFWEFGEKPETLNTLPILEGVSIESDIVDRKVVITARDRELFGIWCVSQNDCYGFDREGIVFARVPRVKGALILKINDTNNRAVVPGLPIFAGAGWTEKVFKTLEIIRRYDFAVSLVEIRDLDLEEWKVEVASGLPAQAGPRFYFSLGFVPENLESILKNLDKRFEFNKVTYFDFRVPNRIYYK